MLRRKYDYLIGIATIVIVMAGIAECGLGLAQICGFAERRHSLFPATGSFYNPGPFACFLAVIVPVGLNAVLNGSKVPIRLLSAVFLAGAAVLLPALLSRTAWIAAAVGCVPVVASRWLALFTRRRVVIAVAAAILMIPALYFIKPASAMGRLLIWRCALDAMTLNGLAGVGWDSTGAAIGEAQERFFLMNPDSPFTAVAGSPDYAFNEFLQAGVAFGAVGLMALVAILTLALFCAFKARMAGIAGAIVAFIVVAMGSYPLQFPEFVCLLGALVTVAVAGYRGIPWQGRCVAAVAVLICAGWCAQQTHFRIQARREWSYLSYRYRYGLDDADIARLDSMLTVDCHAANSPMLFDYGKALRETGLLEKSQQVLMQGNRTSGDPMFLVLMGRNLQDMGDFSGAEEMYRRAWTRVPSRIYPLYLLAMLYHSGGLHDREKFMDIYDRVTAMDVKVMSPAVADMKRQLRQAMLEETAQAEKEDIEI